MAVFAQYNGIDAIDQYLALLAHRPHLAAPRPALKVVTDRDALIAHHIATHEALGLLIRSPFGLTIVDLVENSGVRFPYIRLVSPFDDHGQEPSGVAVVAITEDDQLVLIETLRHATGQHHLELPRGFRGPDEDLVAAAKRELQEETGYEAGNGRVLGTTRTDSGLTAARVAFVLVRTVGQGQAQPEVAESIAAVRLFDRTTGAQAITDGTIDDSFTVQAFGLLACSWWAEASESSGATTYGHVRPLGDLP